MSALDTELQIALAEIGSITPWFSEDDGLYVFEHALYPWVMHADPTPELTVAGYHRALRGFIEDRMAGTVATVTTAGTAGRGGLRAGAGRPRKAARTRIYIDSDLAQWLKDEANQHQLRHWLQQAG